MGVNSNTCTIGLILLRDNNTVGYAGGLQGNAARVIPTNLEYLSKADSVVLSTGNIDFTLVAHVYLNSTSNIMVIANKGDMNNQNVRDYSLYYGGAGGSFGFRVGNGSTTAAVTSSQIVTANAWYTIVAWHSAANDTLNIQVNNGTVNSISYAGGAMDTTFPLSIGAHSNGSYGFDGRIDEVALYKRVLTASERTWLYNRGFGRNFAELGSSSG
ncbi:MAG TPA: LamG domain-containing protein, partial [Anaerolineales bacterium]